MEKNFVSWQWHPCSAEIINCNPLNGIPLKLVADSPLKIGNEEYILEVNITLSKSFNFSREIGWNWHKSWNLPDVQCTFKVSEDKNSEILKSLNLSASLFVVKTHYQTMNLESIGCKGSTQQQVFNGRCVFKCLKFSTTSYNNEHQNFQLVVAVTYTNEQKEQTICCSRISSNIFVDSRKHARSQSKQNSPQAFIEPFLPENLDKMLFKRENRSKESTILEIDNSYQGAINYFTAANIRHKIKHPLFLALRFEKCFKLYVDPNTIDLTKNIIQQLHNSLVNEDGEKNKNNKYKAINLLFDIENIDTQMQRKALEIIQLLENEKYDIFTKKSYIMPELVPIEKMNSLNQEYKTVYPYLLSQNNVGSYISEKVTNQDDLNKINIKEPESPNSQIPQSQIQDQSLPNFELLQKKIKQESQTNVESTLPIPIMPQHPQLPFLNYQSILLYQFYLDQLLQYQLQQAYDQRILQFYYQYQFSYFQQYNFHSNFI